jgi:hypothetical protein
MRLSTRWGVIDVTLGRERLPIPPPARPARVDEDRREMGLIESPLVDESTPPKPTNDDLF